MKRVIVYLSVLAMLLSFSACTVRHPEAAVEPDTGQQTEVTEQKKTKEQKKKEKEKKKDVSQKETAPASGTDLLVFEPLSGEALSSLTALRASITEAGDCCGIAFLGYVPPTCPLEEGIVSCGLLDAENAPELLERYPFICEIAGAHCVNPAFSELYCLVPAAPDAKVRVTRQVMDDSAEPTDEVAAVLYDSDDGAPIFLSAESNGWGGSNVRVTVTDAQGRETSFIPAILCNLGTIAESDGVFDFSVYPDGAMLPQ